MLELYRVIILQCFPGKNFAACYVNFGIGVSAENAFVRLSAECLVTFLFVSRVACKFSFVLSAMPR